MPETVVERLRGDRLDRYWPLIEQELDAVPVIWNPWWTKDSLRTMIDAERVQCWGAGTEEVIRLVAFTQILVYPVQQVAQAFLLFGRDLDEHLPEMLATFERFGIANNCQSLEIIGRSGWESKLKSAGYTKTQVILHRPLANTRMQ